MTKKRLLYFCSDYNIGLTQAQTQMAISLSNEGSIELVCVSSDNEQEKELFAKLQEHHINIITIPDLDVHASFRKLADRISEIISEYKITHVNVHNNWQMALLSYLKAIPNTSKFKLIYTIHGYRHNSPWKRIPAIAAIGTMLFLFADRIISMSSYVSNRFKALKYKTDIVFYAMNQQEFKKGNNVIETDSIKMVFPAQFRNGKRQDMLINAVKKYIEKTGDTSIRLHLPGNGPLLDKMMNLAKKLGISKNVSFPGKLTLQEVFGLYNKCNIALCSSNVETYGRCIAEPFALGRCVITRPTGVALDLIKDGKTGRFFRNENELADILSDLHKNPDRIAEMAKHAFGQKSMFEPQNVIKTYLETIEKA